MALFYLVENEWLESRYWNDENSASTMWTFLMGVLLKKENLYCLRLRKKYSPIHACMQKVGMQDKFWFLQCWQTLTCRSTLISALLRLYSNSVKSWICDMGVNSSLCSVDAHIIATGLTFSVYQLYFHNIGLFCSQVCILPILYT